MTHLLSKIKWKLKKYIKLNDNENTTYQNLQVVPGVKFITIRYKHWGEERLKKPGTKHLSQVS